MTTEAKNRPFEIKKSKVRAKIWKRVGESGSVRFTTDIFRTYKVAEGKRNGPEDSGFRDSHSFGEDELSVIPDLVREVQAYIASQLK